MRIHWIFFSILKITTTFSPVPSFLNCVSSGNSERYGGYCLPLYPVGCLKRTVKRISDVAVLSGEVTTGKAPLNWQPIAFCLKSTCLAGRKAIRQPVMK